MMKVLHVAEAMEGGVLRHLRDLVSALDASAFASVLAVSFARGACSEEAERAFYGKRDVAVCEVPMRRGIAPLSDAVCLWRLVRLIRRVRPDVVHAHSAKAGFLGRLAGKICGVPVVYTPHAFPFLMRCGRVSQTAYRGLERLAVSWTATLIAVSEEERREALALGFAPGRVRLIRNGVPPAKEPVAAPRARGPWTIAFFGRLTPQKGADLLVEAAREVTRARSDVVFRLFGSDGGQAGALQRRIDAYGLSGAVRLEGECPADEVSERMRESDVVAAPSRWEGCPYAVLEAFRVGVPVVTTAVGGLPDLVRDGESGVLVPSDDATALATALLALLSAPERRRRLSEGGRTVVAPLTAEAMADAVGEVYRSAARPR